MADTLAAVWTATVSADPAALALAEAASDRGWTRAELAAAAAAWRTEFAPGAAWERRLVVMAEPNGAAWFRVFLGLSAAGAVPVPLDATEPAEAQRAVAERIGAAGWWRDGKLHALAARRGRVRPDTCLVKVTSGSTAAPQARRFTHAAMLADGRQICATMDIRPDDRNLAVIPLGHSYGLGNLVLPLLAQGTAVVCAGGPFPQMIAGDCARWKATVFPAVPALLRALVRADVAPAALASLRRVISAGAPLAADVAVAFAEKFGRRVHGFYGTTETGGITFDRTGEATLTGRSVGTPLEGVTIELRRGRRFQVTSAAVAGGCHRPADRAQWNAWGELELLGRAGRTVKIGGRRLDLGEIEAVLRGLTGVREVFATAAGGRDEAGVAVAVIAERAVAELKTDARRRLAPWKVPDRWLVLREFPVTSRGKTDTRRLRAMLAGG